MEKNLHEINGAHIISVTVLGGDDNYNINSKVELMSDAEGTLTMSVGQLPIKEKSKYRLRGEPAVRLNCMDEDQTPFTVTISHHKGSIYIDKRVKEY